MQSYAMTVASKLTPILGLLNVALNNQALSSNRLWATSINYTCSLFGTKTDSSFHLPLNVEAISVVWVNVVKMLM